MKKTSRKEWIVRLVMIGAAFLALLILFLVNREAVFSALSKNFSSNNSNLLWQGLANTFLITLVAFAMGLILGTLVCLVTQSESQNVFILALKQIAKFYVLLFRGTPVVVQLLIIYFIIFASYSGDSLYVAMLAFGLNSGAYVSEIIRGGINAVPLGQYQAGLSLGLSYRSMMQKIILPQAYKNAFPSLCNEVIALIKETSVAGFIGTLDLTLAFRKIANATYDFLTVYLVMGLLYFLIVMLLSAGLSYLERKAFSHA
jgi:amine acid ABC transporter, permease protein, 3-TM region, His/Glu/Gln/Arg/opine family